MFGVLSLEYCLLETSAGRGGDHPLLCRWSTSTTTCTNNGTSTSNRVQRGQEALLVLNMGLSCWIYGTGTSKNEANKVTVGLH
jgi:hypothetical protein